MISARNRHSLHEIPWDKTTAISPDKMSFVTAVLEDGGCRSYPNPRSTSFSFPKIHDYNQNVTIHVAPKKAKTTPASTIKRFFAAVKSRRKDKESPVNLQDEVKPYLEDEYAKEKITDYDLCKLVTQPPGLDYNEWLATHTISFFEHINLMYGTVSEYCTSSTCSTMSGPSNTQYLWFDEKGKKCKCAAPQYVEYVMTFTQKTIQDETLFPTKYGNSFPSSFEVLAKKIHRYLFQVLAHIYGFHYREVVCLALHPHLNSLFVHFMTFNLMYNVLEEKETEILDDLYKKLTDSGKNLNSGAAGDTAEAGSAPQDEQDGASESTSQAATSSGNTSSDKVANGSATTSTTTKVPATPHGQCDAGSTTSNQTSCQSSASGPSGDHLDGTTPSSDCLTNPSQDKVGEGSSQRSRSPSPALPPPPPPLTAEEAQEGQLYDSDNNHLTGDVLDSQPLINVESHTTSVSL